MHAHARTHTRDAVLWRDKSSAEEPVEGWPVCEARLTETTLHAAPLREITIHAEPPLPPLHKLGYRTPSRPVKVHPTSRSGRMTNMLAGKNNNWLRPNQDEEHSDGTTVTVFDEPYSCRSSAVTFSRDSIDSYNG